MINPTLLNTYKRTVNNHLLNLRSKRYPEQLVIFESDDWGSIRTPSVEALKVLEKSGAVSSDWPYAKYDALASNKDLDRLFEVLLKFKDKNGNHPILTANVIVANPDFAAILMNDFQLYQWEPLEETLKRYPAHDRVLDTWQAGISQKVFTPQFHGREHVNALRWLRLLQQNDLHVLSGFKQHSFTVVPELSRVKSAFLPAALDYDLEEDLSFIQESLQEGLELFKQRFGETAKSFTAPNYTWDTKMEESLFAQGIRLIQSSRRQRYCLPGKPNNKRKNHFTGECNKIGITYSVRNCYFEPSTRKNREREMERCLNDISIAFQYGVPAIVSTHRLNYVGYLHRENGTENLKLLEQMLKQILKQWPTVRFASSIDILKA